MLWQLNPKQDLSKEIKIALDYYMKKHGQPPTIVLLNPEHQGIKLPDDMKIVVKAYRPVLANLMWVGSE